MKTENAVLMRQARETLKGKWGMVIGACVVYLLIIGAANGARGIGWFVSLIINGPLSLGLSIFTLNLSRGKEAKFTQIFEGFDRFGESVIAFLWMTLFIFLWSLLLIIPGIIASISYSQTFYILADNNSIKAKEAVKRSKKMMYGYKWKYFCLGLRFLGWFVLSILTLGIGFLWFFPYMQVSMAKFYEDIAKESTETTIEPIATS